MKLKYNLLFNETRSRFTIKVKKTWFFIILLDIKQISKSFLVQGGQNEKSIDSEYLTEQEFYEIVIDDKPVVLTQNELSSLWYDKKSLLKCKKIVKLTQE